MVTTVKARYEDGALQPLEPLDLDEGAEVTVSVEDAPPPESNGAPPTEGSEETLLELLERLKNSVPPDTWDDVPSDLAMNKKHYLYGHPKEVD